MDRAGIFAGNDPIEIMRRWLAEASKTEVNDPNAMTCATVDQDGLPNARIVLLKEIEADAFVFYTNYDSQKAQELDHAGRAALLLHWKTLGRQIRIRGLVSKEDGAKADAYYASRALESRIGAWASAQSQPLTTRDELLEKVDKYTADLGSNPQRPPNWGGFRVRPLEMEFWCNGDFRLHDRFRWTRGKVDAPWKVLRLSP